MVNITANQFREELVEKEGKFDREVQVTGKVVIQEDESPFEFYEIKNAHFIEGIVFRNCKNLKAGIKFINCTGKLLKFTKCHVSEYSNYFDDIYGGAGLLVDGCKFHHLILDDNPEFERGLKVRNHCEIGKLVIKNSRFKMDSVSISESKVSDVEIEKILSNTGTRLHKTEVNGSIRVFKILGGFSIIRSIVQEDIHLAGLVGSLTFNNSVFHDNLYVNGVDIDQFTSSGDDFKKGLQLNVDDDSFEYQGSIKKAYIQNSQSGEGISFDGCRAESSIEEIKIPATNLLSGLISFRNFTGIKMEINGINSNASLVFKSCRFNDLIIRDFYNQAGLSFTYCKGAGENSKFVVDGSDLGRASFLNVDFTGFNDVDIRNSIINSCYFIGGKLFKPEQVSKRMQGLIDDGHPGIDDKNLQNQSRRRREIYRQIKDALSKHGDSILASKMRAIELKMHREELKYGGGTIGDRLSLWLSLSNNMGQSWIKPLTFLFVITLALHPFIVEAHSSMLTWTDIHVPMRYSWNVIGSEYAKYWGYFWNMFNPLRNLNYVFNKELGNLNAQVYFWDGLHRIVLAFFIFQIVTAFRKYIK